MSVTITILNDPAGIAERNRYFIDAGVNILDFLIGEYGINGFAVPTIIYKNGLDKGDVIFKTSTDDTLAFYANGFTEEGMTLIGGDQITIIHCPLGVEFAIAVFVVAIIAARLVDVPEIPEFRTPTESPNNSLTGQTNIARPLQRIPDLYGVNRIYPDLIARSYFEYINNVKFLTEYMCVGRGEHLIEDIKSGGTLISDITGSTAEVFEPFTRPLELLNVADTNEVNGQEIIAPNADKVFTTASDVDYTSTSVFISTNSGLDAFSDLTNGDTFKIIGFGYSNRVATSGIFNFSGATVGSVVGGFQTFQVGDYVTFSGTNNGNDGTQVIVSNVGSTITCVDPITGLPTSFNAESSSGNIASTFFPNEGDFTFVSFSESLGVRTITVSETVFTLLNGANNNYASDAAAVSTLGPFNVPGNPDDVWFDINFPRGLINGSNPFSVQFNFILQQVDSSGTPIGSQEDNFQTFTGFNNEPLFFTEKVNPLVSDAIYTATIERLTDTLSASDESKWTRLAGVKDVTQTDFGNVTTMLVETQATDQATKQQERKLNCKATRKLITFENGQLTTAPEPTAKFADALLNELTDPFMGNKPTSQIDLDELYSFQAELDNDPIYGDKLGRCCYSFSNQRTPVGDELKTIANSVRGIVLRLGDIVSFTRDQLQPNRVTILNKRNKKPDSETKTVRFNRPSDFDGIELQWVDEETGDAATIIFPENLSGENLKRIDAAGIKNFEQAWNRAKYEFLKLQSQRTNVETTVTKDGLLLSLNERIANVDGTDVFSQDGEITAISGLIASTTERVRFSGGSGAVVLRAENGDASQLITVTPRTDTESGYILSQLPNFAIVIRGDNSIQKGTLYNFFPDNNDAASDYLVQNISPDSDGYVDLTLINYAPEIYAPDTETPPVI